MFINDNKNTGLNLEFDSVNAATLNKHDVGNDDPPDKLLLINYRWTANTDSDYSVDVTGHKYVLVEEDNGEAL